jgi:hypothetical protein
MVVIGEEPSLVAKDKVVIKLSSLSGYKVYGLVVVLLKNALPSPLTL